MSEIDEFQIWTSAVLEYVYRFYHLQSGEMAELVVPRERLTEEEKMSFLTSRSWHEKDAPLLDPDVRLAIESNGRRRIVTSPSLVESYLKLGEKPFLRKHNEAEFRKLLEIQHQLARHAGADSKRAADSAITAEFRKLAETEGAFVQWFVEHRFPVPVREVRGPQHLT